MSEDPEAKITIRSVHDTLTNLVLEVAKLTTSIAVKDQHRTLKDDEYERRLQNHGDRIRDLEQKEAARDDHGQEIKSLREAVDALEAAVNRSAWLPVIVTGVLVSVIAGITIAVITKSLGG